MLETSQDSNVDARIVYWGAEGAGKSTNLRTVVGKLRPDHRGELREIPSRVDPTVSYEMLPIELGVVAGVRTRIQLVSVPGSADQAVTRKQLLDQVDGLVFVVDSRTEQLEDTLAALDELRRGLADYGRSLDDVALVVQYNKRDLADPYGIDELHRKLGLGKTPVFEAIASEGTGVLQTLSTISKRVIRSLRERPAAPPAPAIEPEPAPIDLTAEAPGNLASEAPGEFEAPTVVEFKTPDFKTPELPRPEPPLPEPAPVQRMEEAILSEAEKPDDAEIAERTRVQLSAPLEPLSGELEAPGHARVGPGLSIVSVGQATRSGERSIRIPLVLGDEQGGTSSMVLSIQLDPLGDQESG